MAKRQILKNIRISEVSSVDRPAQKGAVAVLIKRDSSGDDGKDLSKRTSLTTEAEGHQHILWEDRGNGELNSGETDYVDGHTHPWVRDNAGNVNIGMARGHTHGLGTIGKKETTAMPKINTRAELTAAIEKAQAEGDKLTVATVQEIHKAASELNADDALPASGPLAKAAPPFLSEDEQKKLKAKMDRMDKRDALSGDLRKHYDSLDTDEARDAFLAKDAGAQKLELEKAAGDDPVVYTTLDGIEIRKSAGEPVITALKNADEARRETAIEKAARQNLELEKRVNDELGNVGGELVGKKALLKAVDGIADETQRAAALSVLKSANKVAETSGIFEKRGTGATPSIEKGSPEGQLEELAKARASKDGISFEKAYDAVLTTPEGAQLYAQVTAS